MYWLSKKSTKLLMVLPALIFFCVYIIIPIGMTIYYSFTDYTGIGLPHIIGLQNYKILFSDNIFLISLKNTILILVSIIVLIIPISFILALLLEKPFKGNGVFKTLNFLPFVIAPILVGLIWYFILDPSMGLINNFLEVANLSFLKKKWIGGTTLTPYSIAVVYLWQVLGYYATIFLSGLKAIPGELYESAEIDGAGSLQRIFYVTIPMLKETIVMTVILVVTGGFKIFETVLQLTNGGPSHLSEVLVTYMYQVSFKNSRYGYGMSIATVAAAFSCICTVVYLMISRKSMEDGTE